MGIRLRFGRKTERDQYRTYSGMSLPEEPNQLPLHPEESPIATRRNQNEVATDSVSKLSFDAKKRVEAPAEQRHPRWPRWWRGKEEVLYCSSLAHPSKPGKIQRPFIFRQPTDECAERFSDGSPSPEFRLPNRNA
jgi:hypothetical protein